MKQLTGWILGFIATASWGSFYIVGRWLFGESGDEIDPFFFTFLRLVLAAAALSPLLWARGGRVLVGQAFRRDLKAFLLIAFVGIVLETFLSFYALAFTTAARTSLMANCSPIATVLLAFLLLHEKMPRSGLFGMGIGLAGIVLVAFSRGGDIYADTGLRSLIGDGLALASALCWSFFTVAGARLSQQYGGPVCMFVCFLFGAAMMLPVLPFAVRGFDPAALPPRFWFGLLYTGVVTLALANACWYAALRYLRPGVLGAFGYLSAAITFTLSAIVLRERFTPPFILAIVLTLGGLALMLRAGKKA